MFLKRGSLRSESKIGLTVISNAETISLRENLCEPGECLFLVVQPLEGQ